LEHFNEETIMIDAREEILAPVPHTGHRRTAKVSASRESKGGRSAGKKIPGH